MIDGIVQFQNNVLDLFQSLKRSTSSIDHDTSSTCYTYIIYGCHNYQNTTTYDVRNNKSDILFLYLQCNGMLDIRFKIKYHYIALFFVAICDLKPQCFDCKDLLEYHYLRSRYVSKFD